MNFKKLFLTLFLGSSLLLFGCSNKTIENSPINTTNTIIEESSNTNDNNIVYSIDELKQNSVNELGMVMVLMYHSIGYPESTWTRTPENFRKDLETLYQSGYRAISLNDYVSGNITTELGYTPVVITFDDGNENNFKLIPENNEKIIDPKSAIGILENFKIDYPDFNTTATFFLNSNPFKISDEIEYKLKYLVSNGYDVGNHTYNHLSLGKSSIDEGIKNLALEKDMISQYLPDYNLNTLALPFGERPKEEELYAKIIESSYENISYKNDAILLVGWDPYKSPYHIKFDPYNIHRVRASEINVDGVGLYDWLATFKNGSKTRYISDGNPNTIVAPESYQEVLNSSNFSTKEIIYY